MVPILHTRKLRFRASATCLRPGTRCWNRFHSTVCMCMSVCADAKTHTSQPEVPGKPHHRRKPKISTTGGYKVPFWNRQPWKTFVGNVILDNLSVWFREQPRCLPTKSNILTWATGEKLSLSGNVRQGLRERRLRSFSNKDFSPSGDWKILLSYLLMDQQIWRWILLPLTTLYFVFLDLLWISEFSWAQKQAYRFCISSGDVTIVNLSNTLLHFYASQLPCIILFKSLIKEAPVVSTPGKSSSFGSKRTILATFFSSPCLEGGQLIIFHS